MNPDPIRVERVTTDSRLFAHTRGDINHAHMPGFLDPDLPKRGDVERSAEAFS